MEALKETSIHHMALKILSDITTMNGYDEIIYKTVQVGMKSLAHSGSKFKHLHFRSEIRLFTRCR